MRLVVSGSAGHLGEALMRLLRAQGRDATGLDILASPFTDAVGPVTDRAFVADVLRGAGAVIHAATLHKPHVATHTRQDFIDTNITGTLTLLEEATANRLSAFVFTSTTSVFGAALSPEGDAPAAWIDEDVRPVPKNIYGVTKAAAEDLCQLFHFRAGLPCIVLRTARFFPEADDDAATRAAYGDANAKVNEFLFRRVDIEDAAEAHLLALARAPALGFGRYVVSATTPFSRDQVAALRADAPGVLAGIVPAQPAAYARLGWRMFPAIDRVYDNARARAALGWTPRFDFARVMAQALAGEALGSRLAAAVGCKFYHGAAFAEGPYPVER